MCGEIEFGKCDFCQQAKQVERTYLHPSKYVKEQGAFINKTLYNEGDYFIIVKTCSECGTPTSSQTEISDEEIYKASFEKESIDWHDGFIACAKWYKEQIKSRQ
jgi:hypothetical protein